jgi:fumarylacetoacetase
MLIPMRDVTPHMPMVVSEFTDFYSGRHHATNVGTMFRGADNALPPNWLHMPIGYNGRASSVVVSGTDIRRPWGQLKSPDHDRPAFLPSRRFDLELEMGAIVGMSSDGPLSVDEADGAIFGYVLLNDWSARDIQAWEYQPLGPFQAKATATSISPWIVTKAALAPFRTSTPDREVALLDHLKDTGPMLYDIALSVTLAPQDKAATTIAQTNFKEMYFSAAQQLAHHSTSGCPMNAGDLLGSGTISGPTRDERGSLLELSWGGKEPLTLDTGETRTFLQDGDTLTLSGHAAGDGYRIGFGTCSGTILPALADPYAR